jgi:hypothetical protein
MEEALDEDEDNDGGEEVVFDEKAALPDAPASMAVDIPWGGGERVEGASVDAVGAVASWMSGRSSVTHTDDTN